MRYCVSAFGSVDYGRNGSWAEMLIASILSPFYPESRPMRGHPGLAALCQKQTSRGPDLDVAKPLFIPKRRYRIALNEGCDCQAIHQKNKRI
jgi:hypothetical protein